MPQRRLQNVFESLAILIYIVAGETPCLSPIVIKHDGSLVGIEICVPINIYAKWICRQSPLKPHPRTLRRHCEFYVVLVTFRTVSSIILDTCRRLELGNIRTFSNDMSEISGPAK